MADATIAAIGCSGSIAAPFISGFLNGGVKVRLLARNPAEVATRCAGAEVVAGSMSSPHAVAQLVKGVDAAFLMTPMGLRNNPGSEIDIAYRVIEGARAGGLSHLVYTSVLGADVHRGVGILDAKYEIERMIRASGIPCTILRCGSYMEDVFNLRLALLDKGRFLFPVNRQRRFRYTCQRDVPAFVAHLLASGGPGGVINFVAPREYSLGKVEQALSEASGKRIRATAKFPTYYLYHSLLPFFHLAGHRFSSIIPLVRYFDRHGYSDTGSDVGSRYPEFRMTTLEEHLSGLWPERQRPAPLGSVSLPKKKTGK